MLASGTPSERFIDNDLAAARLNAATARLQAETQKRSERIDRHGRVRSFVVHVGLDSPRVDLDGSTYPVTSEQARILEGIAEGRGGYVSSANLKQNALSEEDPGRCISRLDPQILSMIESKRGPSGGYRLTRNPDIVGGDPPASMQR